MAENTELFHIMRTTRAMRRLKPDPVPDELILQILQAGQWAANGGANQRWRFLVVKDRSIKERVQVWYQKAFDEVVGPRYRGSEPPPGFQSRSLPAAARRRGVSDRALPRGAGVDRGVSGRRSGDADQVGRRVDIPGRAEHAAGGSCAGPWVNFDQPAPAS